MRLVFGPINFLFNSFGGFLLNAQSIFLNAYTDYIWILLTMVLIMLVLQFYFLESPFLLYKQRNIIELHKCLLAISRRNADGDQLKKMQFTLESTLRFGITYEEENEAHQTIQSRSKDSFIKSIKSLENKRYDTNKRFSVNKISLFFEDIKIKQNIGKYFKIALIILPVQFSFGMTLLFNKNLGIKNIFLSGCFITSIQLIGYLINVLTVLRFGRKQINTMYFSLTLVLCAILLIMNVISNQYVPYHKRGDMYRGFETGTVIRHRALHYYVNQSFFRYIFIIHCRAV